MNVYGKYNEWGYELWVDDNGDVIEEYQAGNHTLDSAQQVALDSVCAVPLETIKKYAEQTGNDMAEEHGAIFVGVEYEKPEHLVQQEA